MRDQALCELSRFLGTQRRKNSLFLSIPSSYWEDTGEMPRRSTVLGLVPVFVAILLGGCATNLGTGAKVVQNLEDTHPTTVGRLIEAQLDTDGRLRIYVETDESVRVLAMVRSDNESLLKRIAERYLEAGQGHPIYVYGPLCVGLEEMIVVPHCQRALALGIWDPHLESYVVYSTEHGSGDFFESKGFGAFVGAVDKVGGVARNAL